VDDKEDFAGLMINYGDPSAQDSAIELGTDPKSVHIKINGKDGLPRANLDFDGDHKPTWQFDDAASAAKAAKAAPTTTN
jgi:hypothetical protein